MDAYERALYMSPEYVKDSKLRLLFLRSNSYDPHKAALNLLSHFTTKLELFGKDLLTKHITLADLDSDTIVALKQGSEQLLPVRDSNNRLIFTMVPTGHTPIYGTRARVCFFVVLSFFVVVGKR